MQQVGQSHGPLASPNSTWTYPDRLKLDLEFDADRLSVDLSKLEEAEWTAHFVPQNYEGRWDVLPLRAQAGATHPILRIVSPPDVRDFETTEFLTACPYLCEVLASLACTLLAVRLMRLAPGAQIKQHRDPGLDAESGVVRLHVPIATNDAVDFRVNGTRVDMAPGSLWYLRLSDPHSVTNAGDCARVHLVIDAEMNDWLAAKLRAAAAR